jgi:hypothetical protein
MVILIECELCDCLEGEIHVVSVLSRRLKVRNVSMILTPVLGLLFRNLQGISLNKTEFLTSVNSPLGFPSRFCYPKLQMESSQRFVGSPELGIHPASSEDF